MPTASTDSPLGIVTRSTGSWYQVLHEGSTLSCRSRGRIRLKGIRATNPIAVGDRVRFTIETDGSGVIESIEPRSNYIIRRATNLSKEYHIIAANLDLAIVMVTLCAPPTPLPFIDRFLATAQAYRIPATVVLAKQDLPEERAATQEADLESIYRQAGYQVLALSATTGEGVDALRQMLTGRTTLIAGNSGVGKSSLINALAPDLHLRTAPLSAVHGIGQHTTTFSEMFTLDASAGTHVIDTPGIKGFGVVDFERGQISHFFPDIFALAPQCQFANCLHDQEPRCAVRAAVESGHLAISRYISYLDLLHGEGEKYR